MATGCRVSTWSSRTPPEPAATEPTGHLSNLIRLRNIGPTTADWLADIGISTVEELDSPGSVEAYRRLKAARPRQLTFVGLYALEAALLDIAWTDLPL